MTNPVLEYVAEYGSTSQREELTKEAAGGVGKWWSKQSPFTRKVVGGAGLFLAGQAAAEAYGGVKGAVQKSYGFRSMMKHNPGLAKEDKKKVHALYNTLYNVSPDLAKDPIVSNSWVTRMMYQDEYVDPKTMQDLATAQQRMSDHRRKSGPDFAALTKGINEADAGADLFTPGARAKNDYTVPGSSPSGGFSPSGGGGGRRPGGNQPTTPNVTPEQNQQAQQVANQQWGSRGPRRGGGRNRRRR